MRKSEEYLALEREEKELEDRLDEVTARLDELLRKQQEACAHKHINTFRGYFGSDDMEVCQECGATRCI